MIGALRIATLGAVPLIDKSESRYAEIGRQMVATGDWVTPRLELDRPYWGKPPLHFWATALGLRWLGSAEVAVRFPSLLGAVVVLLVTERVARRLRGAEVAALACLILASCGLFFTLAVQVSLDLTLSACTSIALGAFFLAHDSVDRRAARRLHWLGFLALGAGLLAKGPVAVALWAGTLVLASLLVRDLRWLRGVPWFSGFALTACVSLPWFLAAEHSTPGFLWYFFVQENFLRFVVSDYGDLYGHGHTLPYGTIWGFVLLALLPWSPALLVLGWRGLRTGALARLKEDPSRAFLLAWSVAPLAFFTPSRNIVVTYVLPALPAIAVLLADGMAARTTTGNTAERAATASPGLAASLLLGGGIVLVGVVVGLAVVAQQVSVPGSALALLGALLAACAAGLVSCARNPRRVGLIVATALCIPLIDAVGRLLLAHEIGALASTRDLVASVRSIQSERRCELAFFRDVPLSARFYLGDGGLSLEGDRSRLDSLASDTECRMVAMRRRDLRRLDQDALRGLKPVRDFGGYVLFENAAAAPARAGSA
jgi:4-amino-4-deoxy-L-arabinose transferase-like glycosyltransferase